MSARLTVGVLALCAAGCSAAGSLAPPASGGAYRTAGARTRSASSGPIQHVVFILQENRSFNNLFMGYPGATTQNYGYDETGAKIRLHAQGFATAWDIDHSASAFFIDDDNGKLDGWNDQKVCCGTIPANFAYAYVPKSETAPYWKLAKEYVLADNMFSSQLDGSFVAHQYAVAAYSNSAVNYPSTWGCWGGPSNEIRTLHQDRTYGPYIPMCFNIPTIGNEADGAGITWRYYAGTPSGDGGIWSAYQNISSIYYGSDWSSDVISPPAQFLTDIGNGTLENITWITPTFEASDHSGSGSTKGPAWVASLVNAIGESPFWNSTAVFIIWDDWGGWFDSVAPVYEDYDGLGFRVPMLMISPYAKKGYVTHVQYETSSVVRFMEDAFGLGQLAASDARAADPASDASTTAKSRESSSPSAAARRWTTG
jgi:phospholipase C